MSRQPPNQSEPPPLGPDGSGQEGYFPQYFPYYAYGHPAPMAQGFYQAPPTNAAMMHHYQQMHQMAMYQAAVRQAMYQRDAYMQGQGPYVDPSSLPLESPSEPSAPASPPQQLPPQRASAPNYSSEEEEALTKRRPMVFTKDRSRWVLKQPPPEIAEPVSSKGPLSAWGTALPAQVAHRSEVPVSSPKAPQAPSAAPSGPPLSKTAPSVVDALHVLCGSLPRQQFHANALDELISYWRKPVAVESLNFQVKGLKNSKQQNVCYVNSVIQMLVPIGGMAELLIRSVSDGKKGQKKIADDNHTWLRVLGSVLRWFKEEGSGDVLTCPGMESLLIKEFGALGVQHDTGEALCAMLEGVHRELRWRLEGETGGLGLEEDSPVYRFCRGIVRVTELLPSGIGRVRREMFLTLQLAPIAKVRKSDLISLLIAHYGTGNGAEGKQLHTLPPALFVELSRHTADNKLVMSQASIAFPGTLEIPSACFAPGRQPDTKTNYQLSGVIVRSGVYSNSGHYWVAQRLNNSWNWINDQEITPINVSQEAQIDSTKNLISSALDVASSWCILLYIDQLAKVKFGP